MAHVLLEDDPVTSDTAVLDDPQLQHATCARLMTYETRSGSGAAELVPELATEPPAVSAGGRVYTFRIRAGYRFSPPSREPVTALAFQRAIERALHTHDHARGSSVDDIVGAAAYRSRRAAHVAGVSARGDRLTIRLTHPSPTLPARMATFGFCAVPRTRRSGLEAWSASQPRARTTSPR